MRRKIFGIFSMLILLAGMLNHAESVRAEDNASDPRTATILDLEELINEALQANPDIAASQKKREALWERPPQAKAWEDPRLGFGVRNVPTQGADFNEIDMTTKEISLSQAIPIPGITSLREKVAVQEAKSADRIYDYTRLQVIRAVKKTYFELYLVNAQISTVENNKELISQFAEIAQSQYAVGNANQQDVLKAQVEHSKFIERLIQFRQQKATITAELNRLLAREESMPLPGEPVLPQNRIRLSETELYESAQSDNPGLLSLQEIIARNKADYDLAEKSYVPEIVLTGVYGQREDNRNTRRSDLFSVLVGFNVPIWFKTKQNRKVAEKYAMVEQSKAEYQALANEIRYKISDLMARQKRELELIDLYENGIIPQAAQSLDSAIAGYQVGSVDFLTLLDNQITLYNAELQVSTAQAQYQMNIADLEVLIGKDLF